MVFLFQFWGTRRHARKREREGARQRGDEVMEAVESSAAKFETEVLSGDCASVVSRPLVTGYYKRGGYRLVMRRSC